MNIYLEVFISAYSDYASQFKKGRRGLSWFSSHRSDSFCPEIKNLFKNLRHAEKEESLKEIITNYLIASQTNFNDKSFCNYLLIYLKRMFPNDGWENYYPKGNKAKLAPESSISPYYSSKQVVLTGSKLSIVTRQETNSLVITSHNLKEILRDEGKRELYEFILNYSDDPATPSFTAAVKMLSIFTNKPVRTFTEEERNTFKHELGEIIRKFDSKSQLDIEKNTYSVKFKTSMYYPQVVKICNFLTKTTPYKRERLYSLLDKLIEYEEGTSLGLQQYHAIKNMCEGLLRDNSFTYKQISFFGLFTSKSKNAVEEIHHIFNTGRVL
ncbi:Uncharacterised protein [Legionella busanensis]|uniref:Uncharacterized protein n=1 Tax=Legionella busanensis TaxID=190655 RepID=A0A378JH69_9GAMM|nr:hypothetical protein [Legionella busanensis]STX50535.1 Uncharacterised protein [Legionella busanensis]